MAKEARVTGTPNLTVSMRADLADRLAAYARKDKTTQSEALDTFIEVYVKHTTLAPMPQGGTFQRKVTGTGEAKLRRYWLDPSTLHLLAEAEQKGYSRSFIVEEAVKKGLSNVV